MKILFSRVVLSLSLCAAVSIQLRAATITFAGAATNLGPGWRTSTLVKPLDINHDNVFGTDGYDLINRPVVTPVYVNQINLLTTYTGGDELYAFLDDPTNFPNLFQPGTLTTGVGSNVVVDQFSIVLNSNAVGRSIRVGFLLDNLDDPYFNDTAVELRLSNSTTAGFFPVLAPLFNDRVPDWVFFDVQGAVAGDTLVVRSYGGASSLATLAGISFDSMAVTNAVTPAAFVEPSAAGSDSLYLTVTAPATSWTNFGNASWLHITSNPGGIGAIATNVVFSFDANPGATRTGTLSIGGQTVAVQQAGAAFVTTASVTPLVTSGLDTPVAIALDASGNVYIADTYHSAIKEWLRSNNTVITLVSNGASFPNCLAVDPSGNVFFSDFPSASIRKWSPIGGVVTSVVTNGLIQPASIALDPAGNIYIVNRPANVVKEWFAADGTMTNLITGLNNPFSLAFDALGNLYVTDTGNFAIKVRSAATGLVSSFLSTSQPSVVALDNSGNLYFTDFSATLKVRSAATGAVSQVPGSANVIPICIAADPLGNIYTYDNNQLDHALEILPRAFVDTTPRAEPLAAGSDSVAAVLPTNQILTAPLAPVSDSPWLNIDSATNGVISFSFTSLGSGVRPGQISMFGQSLTIAQGNFTYALGVDSMVEGPSAGTDQVLLGSSSTIGPWTSAANASWLHAGTSGFGATNVVFSFDANGGPTRAGTLTIAGLTLSITQAGSSYVAANPLIPLVSNRNVGGIAVDRAGNVVFTDQVAPAVQQWSPANNTVTLLPAVGLNYPTGVTVASNGAIYVANYFGNQITQVGGFAVVNNLMAPCRVAADASNNLFICETVGGAIKKWNGVTVTTLISSGLNHPYGVAVDLLGNVYIADSQNNAIKQRNANNNTVIPLVSGLLNPSGVAVDGSGDVFYADTGHHTVYLWSPVNSQSTPVISSLSQPVDVAVDSARNVYIDNFDDAIYEIPRAFVKNNTFIMPSLGGASALPPVVPATQKLDGPFAPTSDSPWLTITGITNGVVKFAVPATTNTTSRTGHINLLGQSTSVVQAGAAISPPVLTGTTIAAGNFTFTFTNTPSPYFTLRATTNLALPLSNWPAVAHLTNVGTGFYQVSIPTNGPFTFYNITWPN